LVWHRYDRLSVIAGLILRPWNQRLSLSFAIHHDNIRTAEFQQFLVDVHRQFRRPVILICDRLGAHRAAVKNLQRAGADWLTVEWLPAYAPELNPVEAIWNQTKCHDLSNRVPDDTHELFDWVAESLNDQHFNSNLLQSFFRRAGLPLLINSS
jgi:transposase